MFEGIRKKGRLYKSPVVDPLIEELSKSEHMSSLASRINHKFNVERDALPTRIGEKNEPSELTEEETTTVKSSSADIHLARARLVSLVKSRATCDQALDFSSTEPSLAAPPVTVPSPSLRND